MLASATVSMVGAPVMRITQNERLRLKLGQRVGQLVRNIGGISADVSSTRFQWSEVPLGVAYVC